MPTISMFYGIIIHLYFFDNQKHKMPHIHADYAGSEGIFTIDDGNMIEGDLPNKQRKMVNAF